VIVAADHDAREYPDRAISNVPESDVVCDGGKAGTEASDRT
jgi:hypothetical protein